VDLLKFISENSSALNGSPFEKGLTAVIRHLKRAEGYLLMGRNNGDEDYFNDVIYRTNQAYEGILKEAYELFTGETVGKLRTVDLEQHFVKKSILSERVAGAFQTYRQEWRNPATHDHRLIFSEQDATLALSTISTFAYLLLDQMIEARASHLQQERTERASVVISEGSDKSSAELVADALMNHALGDVLAGLGKQVREVEVIGTIHGHLAAVFPQATIEREPVIKSKAMRLRPDLILRNKGTSVVIEVKRLSENSEEGIVHGFVKLENYMEGTQTNEGVLYLVPSQPQDAMMTIRLIREAVDDRKGDAKIHLVAPPSVALNAERKLKQSGWKRRI
jgi:hypothetical protein